MKVRAVDLFCGAGGLTFGLEEAGIEVVQGVDIDPACEYPYNANTNAEFLLKNAKEYTAKELKKAWGKPAIKVLVGCAPCQPFSTYTQGPRGNHREKWVLLRKFAELVLEAKPDVVSMENVTPLSRTSTFRKFVRDLEGAGYKVSYSIVDCRHYGAAQMRRRLVLFASRKGPIDILPPTHANEAEWATVKSVIGKLKPLASGQADTGDLLHRASRLSPTNLKRIKASKPGGTWKDWPPKLVAKCHQKKSGKTYPGVYGRMEWDKPGPTITGQCFGFGNGRFGHPEQHRAITLREAALLQTFPPDYEFIPKGQSPQMKTVGRMIGNAVPPLLGNVIGKSILHHLDEVA